MKFYAVITCYLILFQFISPSLCLSDKFKVQPFEIVSESVYFISASDSPEIYEALCLFNAKYKAVALAAKYLKEIGLMKDYGNQKKEMYCLVSDNLGFSIIGKKLLDNKKYYVKLKKKLGIADFMKAEIKDISLEEKEHNFSWQEEMDQYVYKAIAPGEEISRAYRYLRKKEWRMALIYLNHLQKKYPNWHQIYAAKAIGFCAENKPEAMKNSLKISCSLGNEEACEDLKGFLEHGK